MLRSCNLVANKISVNLRDEDITANNKVIDRLYYYDIDTQTLSIIDHANFKDPSVDLHLNHFGKKYRTDDTNLCSLRIPSTCFDVSNTNEESNVNHNIIFFKKETFGTLTEEIIILYTHYDTSMKIFYSVIKLLCKHNNYVKPHECFPADLRISALQFEEKERKSERVQKIFTEAETTWTRDWLDEALILQIEVSKKFCPEDKDPEDFLRCMRYCRKDLPQDLLPHWVTYNRAGQGYFAINNLAQDCFLFDVNNNEMTSLSKLLVPEQKTVIIASSVS